jgi:acyl-CoA thioesterase I
VDKKRVMNSATFSTVRMAQREPVRTFKPAHGTHFFGCFLCCLILAVSPLDAAWAQSSCPTPPDLALRDISLPAAKKEVAADQHLVVLTFGGVHPAGSDAETTGATYPARLEAELRAALPKIEVTVANEAPPGKTTADVPSVLPDLIAKTGARLVIWGPGGRDVAARLNLDVFLNAVKGGIDAVRGAGADLILLDTTFVPSPARMAMIEAYREKLLSVASVNHVPLFRRHAMMRLWSEDGTLNLGARDQTERELVSRHLFSCVAQGLAVPIAAAVR